MDAYQIATHLGVFIAALILGHNHGMRTMHYIYQDRIDQAMEDHFRKEKDEDE